MPHLPIPPDGPEIPKTADPVALLQHDPPLMRGKPRWWPFLLWLGCFYTAWAAVLTWNNLWSSLADHYGIAIAMAAGSYVAGSTPMGGGTIGFPILVLLFGEPATLGRDFSFAVQSIGMTSASIFILSRRMPLEWPMLRAGMAGALIGTPLGILYLAPLIPGLWIKLMFAVVWGAFGILHLAKARRFCSYAGITPTSPVFDTTAGLLVGLLGGGAIASVTGVGIDMLLYCVLVLACHSDLRIAIPSSVVIMAFTSLVGVGTKFLSGGFLPGVFENWLAAAPIVAIGAPLGAFIVQKVGRFPTLFFVAFLCLGQFFWMLHSEREALGSNGLILASLALILVSAALFGLYRFGNSLALRRRSAGEAEGFAR